jgi:hypothetical protein
MSVVHDCTRPEFDDGIPFGCKCFRRVKLGEAEELVLGGHACWKKQRRADGRIVELKGEIVLRRAKHPPCAHTIGHRDIERAFVDKNKAEQARINAYPDAH